MPAYIHLHIYRHVYLHILKFFQCKSVRAGARFFSLCLSLSLSLTHTHTHTQTTHNRAHIDAVNKGIQMADIKNTCSNTTDNTVTKRFITSILRHCP